MFTKWSNSPLKFDSRCYKTFSVCLTISCTLSIKGVDPVYFNFRVSMQKQRASVFGILQAHVFPHSD